MACNIRSSKQQIKLFKNAQDLRESSAKLLAAFGRKITTHMAKKIAGVGLDMDCLRSWASTKSSKDFTGILLQRGLSKVCCKKLCDFFFKS